MARSEGPGPRRIHCKSEDASKLKGKEKKEWFCALPRMRKLSAVQPGLKVDGFELSGGFFWHRRLQSVGVELRLCTPFTTHQSRKIPKLFGFSENWKPPKPSRNHDSEGSEVCRVRSCTKPAVRPYQAQGWFPPNSKL